MKPTCTPGSILVLSVARIRGMDFMSRRALTAPVTHQRGNVVAPGAPPRTVWHPHWTGPFASFGSFDDWQQHVSNRVHSAALDGRSPRKTQTLKDALAA